MSPSAGFQGPALSLHSRPRLWTPPPDPEKPARPYQIGFQVDIQPHTPPRPFGDPLHGSGTWRQRSDVDLCSVTQTELVVAYPPLEHENGLPSSSSPRATLEITGVLAVGDERGAQLVVCSVAPKNSQPPFEAVAKIFDALYYPFESRVAAHVPSNTAKQADVDYTHEAAALDHLRKARQSGRTGLCAPKYFGSWTFSLPITHAGKTLKRSVRLVLMENIKGPSIWRICQNPVDLSPYTEQDRLSILARVLDGIVRQRHTGMYQRDLASRNVILRPSPTSSLPEPVVVDYNIAVVFELSRRGKAPCQLAKLPENPMQFFGTRALPSSQAGRRRIGRTAFDIARGG